MQYLNDILNFSDKQSIKRSQLLFLLAVKILVQMCINNKPVIIYSMIIY